MKRRLSFVIIMVMVIVMIAGCGGKATSAQESNKSEPAQETAAPAPEKTETPEAEKEETDHAEPVAATIRDEVRYWRVREGKLEGQLGADDFKEFAEFSEIEDADVLAFDETRTMFLIEQGSSFFRYDLNKDEVTFLDEGALDARYDAGSIYFFDKDHKEFIIEDWMEGSAAETGNKVENYHYFAEANKIDFPEFYEIQECIKGGDYNTEKYSVIVDEKGDIYDFNQHKITNVHLPEPLDAQYVTTEGACMLVEGTTCSIYHFGESVFSEQLSEGHWIPVAVYYDPDTERVGGILYNLDEKAIYKVNSDGVKVLCEDVQDYEIGRGNEVLFHMNSDGKGCMNEWIIQEQDLPVAEDVIWVSHSDPGFIMEDGEVFVIN